jgi:hypothetical protein
MVGLKFCGFFLKTSQIREFLLVVLNPGQNLATTLKRKIIYFVPVD